MVDRKSGFILLEMLIVVMVMSVVSVSSISFWKVSSKRANMYETHKRISEIEDALHAYFYSYCCFPCAARDISCGVSESGCRVGCVPYVDLGISKRCAVDAHGKPFVYICGVSSDGALQVTIQHDNAKQEDDEIAYVIDVADANYSFDEDSAEIMPTQYGRWKSASQVRIAISKISTRL